MINNQFLLQQCTSRPWYHAGKRVPSQETAYQRFTIHLPGLAKEKCRVGGRNLCVTAIKNMSKHPDSKSAFTSFKYTQLSGLRTIQTALRWYHEIVFNFRPWLEWYLETTGQQLVGGSGLACSCRSDRLKLMQLPVLRIQVNARQMLLLLLPVIGSKEIKEEVE